MNVQNHCTLYYKCMKRFLYVFFFFFFRKLVFDEAEVDIVEFCNILSTPSSYMQSQTTITARFFVCARGSSVSRRIFIGANSAGKKHCREIYNTYFISAQVFSYL
jgi:hypothetical protein